MNDDLATVEIAENSALPAAPLVSVHMLAYQHEKYVAEAIESVVSQQCGFPYELIIGEDCSTDGTRSVVFDYQRRYPHLIRILTARKNVGMHANGARCLHATKGTFVAVCEGDDYWHDPGKLSLQVEAFFANPNASLIHTDYDNRVGDKVLRSVNKLRPPPFLASGNAFHNLLHQNTVYTVTAMYKAEVCREFLAANVTSLHWPFGDYALTLFAALKGPVLYIPQSTATYRRVPGSATNQSRPVFLKFLRAELDCAEVFMKFSPVPSNVQLSVRRYHHEKLLREALLGGNQSEYDTEFCSAIRDECHPSRAADAFNRLLIKLPLALKAYRFMLRIQREIQLLHYEPIDRPVSLR